MGDRDTLTIDSLRDTFHVSDAGWFVCQTGRGRLALFPSREVGKRRTNVGRVNVANVVAAGGRLVATVTGVSGKEALVAAKRKLAGEHRRAA